MERDLDRNILKRHYLGIRILEIDLTPSQEAPVYTPRFKPNEIKHERGLHGRPGVEGLTGRHRGRFYFKGKPR